jgi:hypothetical protein
MAKISKADIATNKIIRAEHLLRIIEALDGTGSAEICATGSFTGSFTGIGNFSQLNVDNLTVFETASVNYLETIYETASVLYSSGSTKFGNTLDDTHEFTGSVFITGSDVVLTDGIFTGNGSGLTNLQSANLDFNTVSYGGITLQLGQTDATPAFNLVDATNYPYSSLTGIPVGIVSSSAQFTDLNAPFTGSFTGSFVGDGSGLTDVPTPNAVVTASNATNDDTIEFLKGGGGTFSVTVNNVENASTASYIFGNNVVGPVSDAVNAVSASYVPGSGVDGAVELANTASYVQGSNVDGAVANATNAVSSSYAITASHALGGNGTFNGTFSGSFSGSYIGDGSQLTGISTGSAETASYVQGSNVDGPVTSANTASYVLGSNIDGAVASSSYAETSSYVPPGVGGIYGGNGTVPSSVVATYFNRQHNICRRNYII